MKKMWKMRKDSEAVTPVIATILMVVITVVLTAVVYVMVMGFYVNVRTPTGSFVGTPTNQTSGYKLTFGVMSPSTTWNSCKFSLLIGGVTSSSSPAVIIMSSGTGTVTVAMGTVGAKTYTAIITDLAADGKISTGDYVVITSSGGFASGSYTLYLLFTSTGDSIASQSWTV